MKKKEIQTTEQIIEEVFTDLLKKLGIEGTVGVTMSEGGADVVVTTDDTGVVIGYHGEVLESLQLLASLIISKKIGTFTRISLEIGDYKKNRTEYLESLAQSTKERVIAEAREVPLPNLKSWERRIVHLLLQEDPEVVSESVGIGRDRTLVVKPR